MSASPLPLDVFILSLSPFYRMCKPNYELVNQTFEPLFLQYKDSQSLLAFQRGCCTQRENALSRVV